MTAAKKDTKEQVGTKDGKGTPEDPIVIDEPKVPVEDTQEQEFVENPRYGVKVTDER